ncbi:MAG TPA: alpha-glucan family phosphorylase [Pyrinomonadaceae bacterium]|nr:alpha-glucan family phosphorylase [Pyrinomonadaceae bacterium]
MTTRTVGETVDEANTEADGRALPETIEALERISWNYWWSWSPDGTAVFRDLDQSLWSDSEHNPRKLLRSVSGYSLMRMATDPVYVERVRRLAEGFDAYMSDAARTWAAGNMPSIKKERPVAYFCAEFGVHHSLPLYSGGLGILAGDHLKSASDLGLPLVGVGLLYHHGYFRQRIRRDGWQEEAYQQISVEDLPLRPVLDGEGEPVRIEIQMRGRRVLVQAWSVEVGRVTLYLLDTNLDENDRIDRLISGHLYGGDRETRCVQEMVLGIGGVRLLRRLGVEPHVFHLNEGHSAFLTLELARELVESGEEFEAAAEQVRSRCAFTTHTPVAAGHDEFLSTLIEFCFGRDYWGALGLTREEFLDLGRVTGGDEEELFGLTPLALRMCRSTNGVSKKHGDVSRELWNKIWPDLRVDEVPITSLTNGVHAPTWVSPLLTSVFRERVGEDWAKVLQDARAWAGAVEAIPDEELWKVRRLLKRRLVAFVRERLYQIRVNRRDEAGDAEAALSLLDPNALTIGFARRVAAYKRWGLLLTDPDRLRNLMTEEGRPVQFVFAGKAHPQDQGAKVILQQIAQWKLDPRVRQSAVFIQDYDQEIARHLVQGVDVWLNVPRRPLEASGTSGEKVALNGGLNLSVLDGWWLEGYDGRNGWAVGEAALDETTEQIDRADAESLYKVLETEVVPTFYDRDERGLPRRWVEMMRHAIRTLAPAFNSDRMVREYAERIYAPGE